MNDQIADNNNSSRFLFDLADYWRENDPEVYGQLLQMQLRQHQQIIEVLNNLPRTIPKKVVDSLLDAWRRQLEFIEHIQQFVDSEQIKNSKSKTVWQVFFDFFPILFSLFLLFLAMRIIYLRKRNKKIRKCWRGLIDILDIRGGGDVDRDYLNDQLYYMNEEIKSLNTIIKNLIQNPNVLDNPAVITLLWYQLTTKKKAYIERFKFNLEYLETLLNDISDISEPVSVSKRERLKSYSRGIYNKSVETVKNLKNYSIVKTVSETTGFLVTKAMNIVAFTFVLAAITQFPMRSKNSIVHQRNNFSRINTNDLHEFSLTPNSFSEPSTIDTEQSTGQSTSKMGMASTIYESHVTIDDTLDLPQQLKGIVQKPTGEQQDLSPTLSKEEIIDLIDTVLFEGEKPSPSETKNRSSIAERYEAQRERERVRAEEKEKLRRSFSQSSSDDADDNDGTSVSTSSNPNFGERVRK